VRNVLLLLGVLALLAGCGTGGKASATGDQQNGAKLFTKNCAGCHTLNAANAHGISGPNLDQAFGPDIKQGFKKSTIQNVVLDQIRQPSPPMPKNLVKGEDAQDVAAYVANVAGQATEQKPTGNDGKAIFASQCASCHTLKAANASGTIGPNLDQLKPAESVVKTQVENGGGVMPAFGKQKILTPAQIDAVSKYVADNAGK
jgi:cytochrome c6